MNKIFDQVSSPYRLNIQIGPFLRSSQARMLHNGIFLFNQLPATIVMPNKHEGKTLLWVRGEESLQVFQTTILPSFLFRHAPCSRVARQKVLEALLGVVSFEFRSWRALRSFFESKLSHFWSRQRFPFFENHKTIELIEKFQLNFFSKEQKEIYFETESRITMTFVSARIP